MINKIDIKQIDFSKMKDRNSRKELTLCDKDNKFEYQISIWLKNGYLDNKKKNVKSKRGLSIRFVYNDTGFFDMYLSIKDAIPKLDKIKNKNEFYKKSYSRGNKAMGISFKFQISNKYLYSIHPSLQISMPEKRYKDIIYTHKKFYYGGSCSPR